MTPQVFDDLMRDEGLRLTAYQDTRGNWTIGYGHTPAVEGERWTVNEAIDTLHEDVAKAVRDLDAKLPWWRTLSDVRQDVMAELAFNMGVGVAPCPEHPEGTGLQEFVNALHAMQTGNWSMASAGLLASRWASQVGARATRLAAMMKTGQRP
jgi:lysozyme